MITCHLLSSIYHSRIWRIVIWVNLGGKLTKIYNGRSAEVLPGWKVVKTSSRHTGQTNSWRSKKNTSETWKTVLGGIPIQGFNPRIRLFITVLSCAFYNDVNTQQQHQHTSTMNHEQPTRQPSHLDQNCPTKLDKSFGTSSCLVPSHKSSHFQFASY
jgi:hypothetical protein